MSLDTMIGFACGTGLTACCWWICYWRKRLARQYSEALVERHCRDTALDYEPLEWTEAEIAEALSSVEWYTRREQLFGPIRPSDN
jgi:hypothetical protein